MRPSLFLLLSLGSIVGCPADDADTGTETDTDSDTDTDTDTDPCADSVTFEQGRTPTAWVHVATTGSDGGGDGSDASPYASVGRAVQDATPGTAVVIHEGTYSGNSSLRQLRGTAAEPIWLGGAPGEGKPVFSGGSQGLHLVEAQYLIVHDLEVEGSADNGINADDGGNYSDPTAAHHIVFRDIAIHDVGSGGNQDCLKLSGLYDLWVLDSTFERCGGGGSGSGVDFVGGHRALVAGNLFQELSANAVQVKGGSADITLRGNHLINAGYRGFNMGGSTGHVYFRPPLSEATPNAEAARVIAEGNLIEGGEAAFAFVGCVDCIARHNTIVNPEKWMMRILQETTSNATYEFLPASNGSVVNNLVVFRRSDVSTDVNIGGNTDSGSFVFANNLFYATDAPGNSTPNLPGTVTGSITGMDPLLNAQGQITAQSPAVGAGAAVGGPPGDRDGDCWASPPAIGADQP